MSEWVLTLSMRHRPSGREFGVDIPFAPLRGEGDTEVLESYLRPALARIKQELIELGPTQPADPA